MQKIYILGAGGFAAECYSYFLRQLVSLKNTSFGGFLAPENKLFPFGLEHLYVGTDSQLQIENNANVIIAVGEPSVRKKLMTQCHSRGIKLFTLIDPSAQISLLAKYGEGNIFCPNCIVNPGVVIGNGNVFNIGVALTHNVSVGCCNVFSPGCILSGFSSVGDCNFAGTFSTLLPKASIGNNNKISAGSFVFKNFEDNLILYGNPAKKVAMIANDG